MKTNNKSGVNRGRANSTSGIATTKKSEAPPAMGPVAAEVHRKSSEAARVYRRSMLTTKAKRADELQISVPPEVRGVTGLAALRKFDHDDDDHKGATVAFKAPDIAAVTAIDVAPKLALADAIDASIGLAQEIRDGSPVVLVDVTDLELLERIALIWRDVMLPSAAACAKISAGGLRHGRHDAAYMVVRSPAKPRDVDDIRRSVLEALALAVPVFAFTPGAEAHLPAELQRACTHRLTLSRLDSATITRTIEIVSGRKCRKRLTSAAASVTSMADIAIAVRFDRKPTVCITGLERLAAEKNATRDSRDLTLDQLHGMDEAVNWARSAIDDVEAWKRKKIPFSSISAKIALNGPPGTGKTTFAKVFAAEAKFPLVTASLAQWQGSGEGHLGHLLRAMKQDFDRARALADPVCVLFIDEFDSFPNRAELTHSHKDYQIEVVNALLEQVDGLASQGHLIIIGACNDVSRCDPALVRPGRLNPVIEIKLPDLATLERMFRVRLGDDLKNEDLTDICERSLGGAGADVERVVADARRMARRDGGRSLTYGDLRNAVSSTHDMSDVQRRRSAVHEAGHIVIEVLLNGADGVHATIAVSSRIGGRVVRTRDLDAAGTYEDYARRLQVLLAGRTAEILLLGDCGHGSGGVPGSDLQIAGAMAAAMAGSIGHSGPHPLLYLASRERTDELLTYSEIRRAAGEELLKAEDACRALLQRHRGALQAVAEVLVEFGRIDGVAVARLMAEQNSWKALRA